MKLHIPEDIFFQRGTPEYNATLRNLDTRNYTERDCSEILGQICAVKKRGETLILKLDNQAVIIRKIK